MLVFYHITIHFHGPEDHDFDFRRRENLKSRIPIMPSLYALCAKNA